MTIEELLAENKRLAGELKYTTQLLDAILTGDMPKECDFTTAIYALRGRNYLKYLEQKEKIESKT